MLIRAGGNGTEVVTLVRRGVFQIAFDLQAEAEPIERLVQRYRNAPMSLADACLVWISELRPKSRIFTTDSDFRIYRRNGRQVIPLLAPPRRLIPAKPPAPRFGVIRCAGRVDRSGIVEAG